MKAHKAKYVNINDFETLIHFFRRFVFDKNIELKGASRKFETCCLINDL